MSNKTRDPEIELYRILLMFGICLLHCVCQGKWSGIWPRNLLVFCIPGFVFISGWFGIRFSVSKIIRLYSIPVYASLIAPLFGGVFVGYWREVLRVWDAERGFWFIHAYVILMLFSPLINSLFDNDEIPFCKKLYIVTPIVFCVMVWGVLLNYNHMKTFIPSSSGLEGGSALTFISIYCVARLCREGRIDQRMKSGWAIGCCVLSGTVLSFSYSYFSHINNPLCLLLAISLFVLFKRIRLPNILGKLIVSISPMMLAVYCISGTIYFPGMPHEFFATIEALKEWFLGHGVGVYAAIFGAAVASFVVGLILELPQLILSMLFARTIHHILDYIDRSFERCVAWFARILS